MRANNQIDNGSTACNLITFRLGDATGNADSQLAALLRTGVLHLAKAAERRIELLRCLLADMTGVDQHEICIVCRVGCDYSPQPRDCPSSAGCHRRSSGSHRSSHRPCAYWRREGECVRDAGGFIRLSFVMLISSMGRLLTVFGAVENRVLAAFALRTDEITPHQRGPNHCAHPFFHCPGQRLAVTLACRWRLVRRTIHRRRQRHP